VQAARFDPALGTFIQVEFEVSARIDSTVDLQIGDVPVASPIRGSVTSDFNVLAPSIALDEWLSVSATTGFVLLEPNTSESFEVESELVTLPFTSTDASICVGSGAVAGGALLLLAGLVVVVRHAPRGASSRR